MPVQTVEIFVIASDHSPLHISCERIKDVVPVGQPHALDVRLLPILKTADGVRWRFVGSDGSVSGGSVAPVTDTGFDAEAIINGTVEEVTARLAGLTPGQLQSVHAAETDREVSRKGVVNAINRAVEALNEDIPQ